MTFYQHRFESVEEYLHHRKPYLLIDEIVRIGSNEIVTRVQLNQAQFFFNGHFPGAAILPGAMMQEMTTQTAGILIAANYNPMKEFDTRDPFFNEFALGVLVKIKQARYRGFSRPGDNLTIKVQLTDHFEQVFEFSGSVTTNETTTMRNRFQLANIPSSTLQGIESVHG